ncbi:MAG: hypothetical protein PHH82_02590 [Candidatus ainarchaeum sp.]|nr:hypothetical protein [Candidatus ainarchaeum sp.]
MGRINSKKKGNRFELEVSKTLIKITGAEWYRVGVSSGARFTKQGIESFQGDILTENPEYRGIIIECKATKDRISMEDLANKKSRFWEWIEQVEGESPGKEWVLIFKANNGKVFFVSKGENKITGKLKVLTKIENYIIFY